MGDELCMNACSISKSSNRQLVIRICANLNYFVYCLYSFSHWSRHDLGAGHADKTDHWSKLKCKVHKIYSSKMIMMVPACMDSQQFI